MPNKEDCPVEPIIFIGTTENRFSKEQLVASERFRERRDILEALLCDGELYTVKAVEEKIENYMKGKVK